MKAGRPSPGGRPFPCLAHCAMSVVTGILAPVSQLLPDGDAAVHPAPSFARGRARETMSLAQARRVVIAAQGLAKNRPETEGKTALPLAGMAALQRLIDRLGLLQIDSVNVLARAHLLPVVARLGSYDTALLARAADKAPRRLVETWAHEASYVPPEIYRAFDWWHAQQWEHRHIAPFVAEHRELLDRVKETLADSGPLTGRQVEAELGHGASRSGPLSRRGDSRVGPAIRPRPWDWHARFAW